MKSVPPWLEEFAAAETADADACRIGAVTPERFYLAFGRWVRRRRRAATLTQRELAARLGMSREWVAGIEAGRHRVLLHQFLALAEVLERRLH